MSADVEDRTQEPVYFGHFGRAQPFHAIANAFLDIDGPELVEHQQGRLTAHCDSGPEDVRVCTG
jgi:hypothetical protein